MSFCYVIALFCGSIKLITNLTLLWQVGAKGGKISGVLLHCKQFATRCAFNLSHYLH